MKDHLSAQRGSVVLVALCLTIVLGVVVVGYVTVCARTMEMSNRSFCTTSSVQLAEIGMEEALWSLNQALTNPAYTWSEWDSPTTSSGIWTITKTRTGFLTNNGIQGRVNIRIDNYNIDQGTNPPQSYTLPLKITVNGISLMPDGITIDKQLVATVKPAALFSNAVGAVDPIPDPSVYFASSSSPGGTVDSYDSTPTAPNNGIYTPYPYVVDPSMVNRSDRAIISGSRLTIKNAIILGYATTANSTGAVSFASGTVTSLTPTGDTSTSPPIDYSRISNNANQYAFDIVPPVGPNGGLLFGGAVTGIQTIGTGATTPSIYYDGSNGINLSGNDTLTIDGPVIIFISNDLKIAGGSSASIVLTANGSAQIYVAGNLDIEGLGIDNRTKRPRKLAIFCSGNPPSTAQVINTATPFYGAVYTPNSPLVVNSNLTVYGALVGQSVTFNGIPTIHYDLDLRTATFSVVNTPYDVWQWVVSN